MYRSTVGTFVIRRRALRFPLVAVCVERCSRGQVSPGRVGLYCPERRSFGDLCAQNPVADLLPPITQLRKSEVLQELAHAYFPVGRQDIFDDALGLISSFSVEVWPLDQEDVELARVLSEQFPALQARDLCYLASCQRRGVTQLKTFGQSLAAATDLM